MCILELIYQFLDPSVVLKGFVGRFRRCSIDRYVFQCKIPCNMGGTNGKPYDELSENEQRRVTKLIFDEIESTSTDPKKFRKLLSSDKYEISAADLDRIRNAEGVSLLYKAVELGREMLVELFLEKGCRARCCNQQLVSALQFAIQAGNKKIVEFLLDYGGADVCLSQDSHGRLPIHYVRFRIP